MPPEMKILESDLRIMYVEKKMSAMEMSKILKCHNQTVLNHLKKFGIPKRRNAPRMIQSIKIPSTIKLAYLAGIVDGEGTISTSSAKNNMDGYTPILAVTNTDKQLISWLISEIGGTYSFNRPKIKHHKIKYQWYTHKTLDIYLLLKAILPYLIVKKDDAIAILELCEERLKFGESMERPLKHRKRYLTSQKGQDNLQ